MDYQFTGGLKTLRLQKMVRPTGKRMFLYGR
jgi:hypothetical protein